MPRLSTAGAPGAGLLAPLGPLFGRITGGWFGGVVRIRIQLLFEGFKSPHRLAQRSPQHLNELLGFRERLGLWGWAVEVKIKHGSIVIGWGRPRQGVFAAGPYPSRERLQRAHPGRKAGFESRRVDQHKH